MAGGNGVWGIDIGQSALKALRCTLGPDGETIVADAFDYIEYPKILSQPDAKPDELVREALKQFLSRNDLRGDKVGIALSGQSGLARFVSLPPVDSKKIPNIVAYEAKQQIPFSLDDVIWDYQQMPGGTEEEGFALESEVGIFAMKRDQVFRSIRPLVDMEVELDIIQLTPLAIYNAVTYDLMGADKPAAKSGDESARRPVVILSMGTDTSDLVVTDGYRVWQRSILLGGNHFTKQLTKELKLTFAKAEHVKRNARKSDDAKAIFQAMRPVFNDLVTEVHRSLGFYQSLERSRGEGEPKYVVALGTAAKLPGLPQYLEKNLGIRVLKLREFKRLVGPEVTEAPAFKNHILSFPVCYGLALQGLGKANLRTNLLPREILRARLIRRKKPWAAAIAAALLLGCALNFFFIWRGWNSVNPENGWQEAQAMVSQVQSESENYKMQDEELNLKLNRLYQLGEATVGAADGRFLWLELMKMISEALPVDQSHPIDVIQTLEERPLEQRKEIYIESIESVYYPDLSSWLAATKPIYEVEARDRKADLAAAQAADASETNAAQGAEVEGTSTQAGSEPFDNPSDPSTDFDGSIDGTDMASDGFDTGSGEEAEDPFANGAWVIQITGRHFYKEGNSDPGASYVRNTLVKHLDEGTVELPTGPGQPSIKFTAKELGIYYPHIFSGKVNRNYEIVNPLAKPAASSQPDRRRSPQNLFGAATTQRNTVRVAAYEFTVQFAWTQTRLRQRLEKREKSEQTTNIAAAN